MLREFVEKKHYLFIDHVDTWQDAIRMSCVSLIADGTVEQGYPEEIVRCVTKYGPYIIIMPMVAMPHSSENAKGVNKTSIGFMKVEDPVHFDPEDPEKDAKLFFTLAACDHSQHMDNMARLSEMLCNEELVNELLEAKSPEDLLKLQEKYLDNHENTNN